MEERGMQDREALVEGGLVTIGQAEDFTALSKSKLYDLMSGGELPFMKIGASRRIPRRALVALVAKHLVLPRDRETASEE